ncbi:SAM-dependent methyltransferase [Tumebacillus algifaecis]|uniref:SAM-dependent methyltransferase n=1 Tax=Tumebacillus algifaecis TaxID=1214604 RepID=A0A223D4T0_9BACL|nr:class I SAM-dependent methyltransferase [Tumebacillus algifaecis]ASS76628.1 SAM-dependent methyltransferase [Tumebacillus algifaecis]
MAINFHAERNRFTYARRHADVSWTAMIEKLVDVRGKHAVDIGCGGGIYSRAFANLGAASVTGIDFSAEMLAGARAQTAGYPQITYQNGDAQVTGLADASCDLILKRALTHHIKAEELTATFAEALRILRPGGTLLIQNRTPEDCLMPGNENHLRGYFFELYPRLIEREIKRRHSSETMLSCLQAAGFTGLEVHEMWETRKVYSDLEDLAADLLTRTGRSILHELSDPELQELVAHIQEQMFKRGIQEVLEQDRWTIWKAVKAAD